MKKRSVKIAGHATSISLEDAFWQELLAIAARDHSTISDLIESVDEQRAPDTNLSSALRLYVLRDLKNRLSA